MQYILHKDYIIKETDCNKKVNTPVALFLDLSKAFDTLTFDILLKIVTEFMESHLH